MASESSKKTEIKPSLKIKILHLFGPASPILRLDNLFFPVATESSNLQSKKSKPNVVTATLGILEVHDLFSKITIAIVKTVPTLSSIQQLGFPSPIAPDPIQEQHSSR